MILRYIIVRSAATWCAAVSVRHEYVTQNGKVVRELVTNKTTGAFIRCLDFLYDESGKPFAMRRYWDASLSSYGTYHYVLNAQGDVVQINYQGGEVKATYTYDAWGRVLTADGELAAMNPIRYRGYYYDTDTGFYYLQSRYYDPANHRFINADALASTGQGFVGTNMFAYCNNNPANLSDTEGNVAGGFCTTYINDGSSRPPKYAGDNYIFAPDGYKMTRLTKSPYDVRANLSEEITYLTPEQTREYVYQNVFSECMEGITAGELTKSASLTTSSFLIGTAVNGKYWGFFVSAITTWGELYAESERARQAQILVGIMEKGHGLIIVDYSVCGIGGRWYFPWDESAQAGRYGSYPYVRTD